MNIQFNKQIKQKYKVVSYPKGAPLSDYLLQLRRNELIFGIYAVEIENEPIIHVLYDPMEIGAENVSAWLDSKGLITERY